MTLLGKAISQVGESDIKRLVNNQVVESTSLESDVAIARVLVNRCHLELVCVTKGAHGSLLVAIDDSHTHPGLKVDVSDTVCSGDAFTTALVYYYLRHLNIKEINRAVNKLVSLVVQYSGGTPEIKPHFCEELP